jgi:hypothetical protein
MELSVNKAGDGCKWKYMVRGRIGGGGQRLPWRSGNGNGSKAGVWQGLDSDLSKTDWDMGFCFCRSDFCRNDL